MKNRLSKKNQQFGSVAVDDLTGIESYGVSKQQKKTKPSSASAPASGITPRYGEVKTGKSKNLANVPDEFMRLFEHDPSEVIMREALKHPIGNLIIYILAFVVIAALLSGAGLFITDSEILGESGLSPGIKLIGTFGAVLISILVAIMAYAATVVYSKSRMILTNQKLVYIRYHSLFSRDVSQLNIGEVQDVSVTQHSIWDRLFKMGNITVETAGEQNNYIFTHVSDPHKFAHLTIQAHEGSIAEYGN